MSATPKMNLVLPYEELRRAFTVLRAAAAAIQETEEKALVKAVFDVLPGQRIQARLRHQKLHVIYEMAAVASGDTGTFEMNVGLVHVLDKHLNDESGEVLLTAQGGQYHLFLPSGHKIIAPISLKQISPSGEGLVPLVPDPRRVWTVSGKELVHLLETSRTVSPRALLFRTETSPPVAIFYRGMGVECVGQADFCLASKSHQPWTVALNFDVRLFLTNPSILSILQQEPEVLFQTDYDDTILHLVAGRLQVIAHHTHYNTSKFKTIVEPEGEALAPKKDLAVILRALVSCACEVRVSFQQDIGIIECKRSESSIKTLFPLTMLRGKPTSFGVRTSYLETAVEAIKTDAILLSWDHEMVAVSGVNDPRNTVFYMKKDR